MFSLHEATEAADIKEVKRLLKDPDIDVNEKDEHGNAALHYAALLGERQILVALLSKNADPGILDGNNRTALSHAIEGTRSSVLWILMRSNIAQKDKLGLTVLDYAKQGAEKSMDDPTFIRRRNYMYTTILVGMHLFHADKSALMDDFCDFLSKMDDENKACIINNIGRVIDLRNQNLETILGCIPLKSLQCSALIKCIRSSVKVPERLYKLSDAYDLSYDSRGVRLFLSAKTLDSINSRTNTSKQSDDLSIQ